MTFGNGYSVYVESSGQADSAERRGWRFEDEG